MTATRKKSPFAAIQAERKNHPHLREDEPWRDFLESRTRKRSLREMTPAEQKTVLLALRPDGKPHHGKPRHQAGDQMLMIRAQWIEIVKLGGVQDGSEEALAAWIAKTCGQDIGLLDVATAQKLIEQLKAWRRRLESARG